MTRRWTWALLAAGAALTGCGDEDPVGLGRELVTGGEVRTFEIVLEGAEFLASDTTLGGFSRTASALFSKVALDAEGGVDAHALSRFGAPSAALQVAVTPDSVVADSALVFPSGTLVLRVDTALSSAAGPVALRLLRTTERWDPATATWTLRVDTAGARLPWTEAGGTGELVDSALWSPGSDSVTFAVDSQTVALWTDTTSLTRGALVVSETGGSDLRVTGTVLRLQARPSVRPDTLIAVTVATLASTFVYQPLAEAGPALRVGGLPAWRTYLDVGALLEGVRVPCAAGPPACTVPLRDATVSFASLLLTPVEGLEGFQAEAPLTLDARAVLGTGLPLSRAPLGSAVGRVTVPADSLLPGSPVIAIPITSFVTDLLGQETAGGGDEDDDEGAAPSRLAVASLPETATFGFATFGPTGSAAPPRLRLIVTVASPLEIR